MAGAWLPGAERVRATRDGGGLAGGAPRVVWHTDESDPEQTPARSAAHQLDRTGWAAHLVWNPVTGDIVQMVPATRAARGLGGEIGGREANREGRMCLQIQVVGFASEPFTAGSLRALEDILRWLDTWGIPRCWPAGPPPAEPSCGNTERDRARWSLGGHFGHSQVPGNKAADPGGIDIATLVPRCRVMPGVAGPDLVWDA